MRSRLRVGRYRLVERLGGGEVAEVWRATDSSGREIVIKRLLPHLAQAPQAEEARRLFARECRLQARLEHPNLVRTISVEEGPLLVLEHVAGPTLQALSAPPVGLVTFVASEVCRALAYLHAGDEAGGRPRLVHRDVTPSNVLLGRDGVVKLIDLGIALPLGDPDYTRTQTGVVKGKLEFVAPERRAGAAGGPESDVYSVGVLVARALGERSLPPDLETLCRATQAAQPGERPTAGALADALRAVADAHGYGARQLAADLAARFAAEVSLSTTKALPDGGAPGARRTWMIAVAAVATVAVIAAGIAARVWYRRAAPVAPHPPASAEARPPSATPAPKAAPAPPVAPVERAPSGVASRAAAPPAAHHRVHHPAVAHPAPAADDPLLGKSLVDPFHAD